ncbi:TetR/AcrR family transcriptional regulator [Cellulosimicrobium protaetiae]|uniref:TetR/AcrR family transcriptional regulator n=1 Tax=Cellulosimicrobium protaetiae TaxID=2587808 RepID=A0A6M5UE36_9MICO|nr:TetR/AcrR family transcriptional regulator [Cellulosimicrobium protaetiae]QJW34949.1 TetR/AcrR family transcriptional regulator [Cellulosimicrobium protaetiae]
MSTPAAARKARLLAEREAQIVAAARVLAEEQGWEAVTTRRLADAIGYSQPVLYGHFPEGRSQIVTAVALLGFEELAAALSAASPAPGAEVRGEDRVRALVVAYLDFAARHPATYEAMFHLPIGAAFASDETPRAMREGYEAIVGTLLALDRPPSDVGTAAEVVWGAMHGVATLQRAGRFSAENHERRVDELVRRVVG